MQAIDRGHNKQQLETCPVRSVDFDSLEQSEPVALRRFVRMPKIKHNLSNISDLNTLDPEEHKGPIQFKVKEKVVIKDGPGVGKYDIASSMIKPTYQTYEKNNHVILVKINHIGGTSSFSGEQQRFLEGSTYQTPGPGSYHTITPNNSNKSRIYRRHNHNYSIINQMIKQNRPKAESIPNYNIPSKGAVKYNGIPRHLQEMYKEIQRNQDQNANAKPQSLPLQYFMELKKRTEQIPIKSTRYQVYEPQLMDIAYRPVDNVSRKHPRPTETMYKVQQQRQMQAERTKKIKAILQTRKPMCLSLGVNKQKKRQFSQLVRNKNMVNILYDSPKRHSQRVASLINTKQQ